jgi:predicted transcriptional regulator
MTGLKTLKDLREPILEIIKLVRQRELLLLSLPSELMFCNALEEYFKQEDAEAIKWIKDLKETRDISNTGDKYYNFSDVIKWIKHFFNLTEEDLK